MTGNALYYGDNLDILRRYIKDESVDLVYLDPPFKSDQNYNVLFAEHSGARAAAQIRAFADTWRWDEAAASSYHEMVEASSKANQTFKQAPRDQKPIAAHPELFGDAPAASHGKKPRRRK